LRWKQFLEILLKKENITDEYLEYCRISEFDGGLEGIFSKFDALYTEFSGEEPPYEVFEELLPTLKLVLATVESTDIAIQINGRVRGSPLDVWLVITTAVILLSRLIYHTGKREIDFQYFKKYTKFMKEEFGISESDSKYLIEKILEHLRK